MNFTREEVQQVLSVLQEEADIYSEVPESFQEAISLLQSKLEKDDGEPDVYQYQSRDGEWKDFINKKHFEDTLAEGSWPIRALFTHPAPKPMTGSLPD